MGIKINNFLGSNKNLNVIGNKGIYTVFEHTSDMSVTPSSASTYYYMSAMGCAPK